MALDFKDPVTPSIFNRRKLYSVPRKLLDLVLTGRYQLLDLQCGSGSLCWKGQWFVESESEVSNARFCLLKSTVLIATWVCLSHFHGCSSCLWSGEISKHFLKVLETYLHLIEIFITKLFLKMKWQKKNGTRRESSVKSAPRLGETSLQSRYNLSSSPEPGYHR